MTDAVKIEPVGYTSIKALNRLAAGHVRYIFAYVGWHRGSERRTAPLFGQNAMDRIMELEATLADICRQKITVEMDRDDRAIADFEHGYDEIIKRARRALKGG